MQNLQHPETGGHILVHDPETAEELLAEGWEEIIDGSSTDDAPATPKASKAKTEEPKLDEDDDEGNEGGNEPSEIPAPEKPLTDMKLTELIEYGGKISMPVEQLDALRKPGTSKATAIDAINAYVAAAAAA